MTHRLQITLEGRRPIDVLRACKILVGLVTAWHVGRGRGGLGARRTGPGWLVRVEDTTLERELEASVERNSGRRLKLVKT